MTAKANNKMRPNSEIVIERRERAVAEREDATRIGRFRTHGGKELKSATVRKAKQIESMIENYGLGYLKEHTFVTAVVKDDATHRPIESPRNLLNDVMNEPALQRCINFKAASVGGMGYHVKQFGIDSQGATDEKNREACDLWTKSVFFPSFTAVCRNADYDYGFSGMGCILVDFGTERIGNAEEVWFFGKKYSRRWYQAIRVRHINRMNVFVLKPRTNAEGRLLPEYELDTIFPRFAISQGDNEGFFAKSFGDPRHINRKTGAVMARYDIKHEAGMLYRKVDYHPLDQWYGYPGWRSAKVDIDTLYDLRRHDYAYFRKNGVPDVIFIIPEVKTDEGTTGADQVEAFLRATAERREVDGGECGPVAVTIEVPMAGIHQSSGKFPITIQEIKQVDPGQFIELRRELIQSIVDVNDIPANLVIPYAKNMGSGKDKQEDLRQYKEFYAEPKRKEFNEEFLDKLFWNCCPVRGWVAHLNMIDTSDPKLLAEIADIWDKVSTLSNGEKREKIGMSHPVLPEDEEKSKEFNNQVFMDFNRIPYDWDAMQRIDTVLEQAKLEQDGVDSGSDEAKSFAKMCDVHKIRVDEVQKRVLPFIRMLELRFKRGRK